MISKSQLKYIQSLGQKKHRDEEGLFLAEGPKLIKELLQNKHAELKYLYALNEWTLNNKELLLKIDVTEIDEAQLAKISQLKTPNQVIGVFKKFDIKEPAIPGRISLVLDAIQDPGNLGTIIRTADWFGISQIICSYDCADIYNPKVVQATMGSIARVQVFYTDLPLWLKRQQTSRIYAAMLAGKDVAKMTAISEGLIIIGNESRGIHDEVLQCVNEKINIPPKTRLDHTAGQGKADSLNVAVATGIILSHLI